MVCRQSNFGSRRDGEAGKGVVGEAMPHWRVSLQHTARYIA